MGTPLPAAAQPRELSAVPPSKNNVVLPSACQFTKFSTSQSNLVVAHINICSLRNKVHDIHQLVYIHKIHILCVTETHLDRSIPDSKVVIPNYNMFRRDRDLHGGGVCIYVHQYLRASSAPQCTNLAVECLTVRVHLPTKPRPTSISVSCAYRPPSSAVDFWEQLSYHIEQSVQSPNSLILGDFNTDVMTPQKSPHYRHLLNFCSEFHLRNVVTEPTRKAKTCLDLALVHADAPVVRTAVSSSDGISDHDLVLLHCAYHTLQPVPTHTYLAIRKPPLQFVNFSSCRSGVHTLLEESEDPDQLNARADRLAKCINTVLDKHSPICNVRLPSFTKPRPQPWVTPALKKLFQRRSYLHRKLRKHAADQQLQQQYRSVRREGTILNRKLKTEYCIHQFKSQSHNPKGQWRVLNQLAGRVPLRSTPIAPLSDLTDTFATVVHDPTRPSSLPLPRPPEGLPVLDEFSSVSVACVEQFLASLNSNKSAGSDGIPPCFLKSCRKEIAIPLTALINQSLRTGEVPCSYKHAHVCPLYKSGDPSLATNYRPVSLLPVASKILEKIIHQQLVSFFHSHPELCALPKEQFAYRRNHSCEDLLGYAINTWQRALDKKGMCGAVFVDMSKAFDRVQHSKLLEELAAVGISGRALMWFADYLSSRSQQVVVRNQMGSTQPCSRGVPQGSVLGPLLFCLYVRRIPAVFRNCQCLLYADDIAFYFISQTTSAIVHSLQEDLNLLLKFLDEKGLVLNPKKTELILFRRPAEPTPIMSLDCDGTAIQPSQSTRYLGLQVDEHLTFEKQVEQVCAKALGKVATFKHGRRNIAMSGRRTFYLSLVQSTLDYASTAYMHSLSAKLYNKIVIVSQQCLRRVFGLDRYTPVPLILSRFNLYSFEQRINLKLYVLVFRCLTSLTSSLLTSIFTPRSASAHTTSVTRGQTSLSLVLPPVSTRYGMHSISFLAADRWNLLPTECRQAHSLPEFVQHLKVFLGFPVRRQSLLGVP